MSVDAAENARDAPVARPGAGNWHSDAPPIIVAGPFSSCETPGLSTAIEYCALVPLCPTENHLHYSGNMRRYATKNYRDWLKVAGPILRAALPEGWTPDTGHWWSVSLDLHLGAIHGDATNYVKAVMDALSGSQPNKDGKIEKPGLLWDDDKRVRQCTVRIVERRCEDPRVGIFAHPTFAPADAREVAKAAAKAAKAVEQELRVIECRRVILQALKHNATSSRGLSFSWLRQYAKEFPPAVVRDTLAALDAEGMVFKSSKGWQLQ